MSDKVYCKKCVHLIQTIGFDCSHADNTIVTSTWLDEDKSYKELPNTINKNNDCKNWNDQDKIVPYGGQDEG